MTLARGFRDPESVGLILTTVPTPSDNRGSVPPSATHRTEGVLKAQVLLQGVFDMKSFRLRLFVSTLAAFAIVAGHLFVPEPADAAGGAMFRISRSWHNDLDTTTGGEVYSDPFYMAYSEPRPSSFTVMTETPSGMTAFITVPPYPAATGLVTSMGGFSIPRHVMHFGTAPYDVYTASCAPADCAPGYPVSIYYYSYYNYKGIFQPQNPNAATTTTTINRIANTPGFTTTQFDNKYAFARFGSIKITPGPNRFGGTMRYFWGLDARWYWILTATSPCCSRGYAHNYRTGKGPYGSPTGMLDSTEYSPQIIGGTHARTQGTIHHTYLTTGGSAMNAITRMEQYVNTTAPWTTGTLEVFQSGGFYISRAVVAGYDNRTENRELGTMSLVVPWLAHQYITSFNPTDPVASPWHNTAINQVRVNFMPEPGGILLMSAGVLGLVGVYRLRRR